MDQLADLGTAIPAVLMPTVQIYSPLLAVHAEPILSCPRETHSYGPHPRQMLDVYSPPDPTTTTTSKAPPILLFLYGGGFVSGDRVLPQSQGLIYTNLGYFFSQHLNILTIIVDYRRISEGAKFPSGGEDVAAAVEWVRKTYAADGEGEARDLFLMGNSAGGVHVATFILDARFAALRQSVAPDSEGRVRLRGYVLLGVPFDFRSAADARAETLNAYYGDRVRQDCPLGLLQRFKPPRDPKESLPRTFVIWATLDPENEIVTPNLNFVQEWEDRGDLGGALDQALLEGHNHISPPLALGTGLQRDEQWGVMVGNWIYDARQ